MPGYSIVSDITNTENNNKFRMYLVEDCPNMNQKEEIYQHLVQEKISLANKIEEYLLDELPFDSGNFKIENIKLLVDEKQINNFIPENVIFFWNEKNVYII